MTEQQTQEEREAVHAAALDYLGRGLNVIRIGREKRPSIPDTPGGKWESLQSERVTPERLTKWYTDTRQGAAAEGLPASVGVVCGAISGNLLVVDFDLEAEQLYPAWRALLEERYPTLAAALEGAPVARTSKGYHVYVRLSRPRAGQKLATYMGERDGKRKLLVLIETRGEGNYAVAPPSPHPSGARYTWVTAPGDIPILSTELEEALIASCRHYDRRNGPEEAQRPADGPALVAQTRPLEDAPPLEELRKMLDHIEPWSITYEEWVGVLMAIHSVYPGPDGLALAEEWGDGKKGEIPHKWKSFKKSGIGVGSLVRMAKERGYTPPRREKPQEKPAAAAQVSQGPATAPASRPALQTHGRELVLVGSPETATRLNAAGLSMRAVGLEGKPLTREQAAGLRKAGAELVVIAVAPEHTEETLRALFRARVDSILVARPLEALGRPEAEEELGRARRAGAWLVEHLLEAHELPLTDIAEERLLGSLAELHAWLEERDRLQAEALVDELCNRLDILYEEIRPRLERAAERVAHESTQSTVETLLHGAAAANEAGDTNAARELVESAARAMASGYAAWPSAYTLAELEHDLINEPESIPLPWEELRGVKFPRAGLSIISAESGAGKTTMMLNLAERFLHESSLAGQTVYFYTYEEPRSHIALKLIMLLAGVTLLEAQNFDAYRSYMRQRSRPEPYPLKPADEPKRAQIERAIRFYETAAGSGRLVIVDSMPRLPELVRTLERVADKGKPAAVFIDYVQLIPAPEEFKAGTRQLELAHIVRELRTTAARKGLAIIMGSQLNKEGDLREAQDIYHEAQVVLKLKKDIDTDALTVTVDKQRSGASNIIQALSWDKPTLRIASRSGGAPAARRVVEE